MRNEFTITIDLKTRFQPKELVNVFGKDITALDVTFEITEVSTHPAEPDVGIKSDYHFVTDVEILSINDDSHDIDLDLRKFAEVYMGSFLPNEITTYIKERCKEETLDHPEWANDFVAAQEDRMYESMMEDRWENDNNF